MTNIHRTSIGVFLLAAAIGLLGLVVFDMLRTDPVSAAVIMQRAEQEKQSVLNGIDGGQILYLRSERYKKSDPSLPENVAWVYPENRTAETWMASGAAGNMTIYTNVTRNLDGEALTYSQMENGQRVATWVATGEQMELGQIGDTALATWVEGVWGMGALLSDWGQSRVGSGQLNGKSSAIFEKQTTTSANFTSKQIQAMHIPVDQLPQERVLVSRQEFTEEKPLLWWSTLWEVDDAGERTLLEGYRIVEYRLLPANMQIGPFN